MDSEYKPTFFDSQLQTHQLQIMKTMIPYLSAGQQRPFALLIKYMELQKQPSFFQWYTYHSGSQQPVSTGADVSDAYRYQRTVYTRRERNYWKLFKYVSDAVCLWYPVFLISSLYHLLFYGSLSTC